MIVKKKIVLSLLALVLCVSTTAQVADKKEVKDVFFAIDFLYKSNDTIFAYPQHAEGLGIDNGTILKAYQLDIDATDRRFREVGSGFIMHTDSVFFCVIKLYHKEDTLETGDLISVKLSIPSLPYRSVFSDLAFKNTIFTNADQEPLYQLQSIIVHDDKKFEDSIYTVIIADLKYTYERVKDRTDLPPVMYKRLTGGRFKGRLPLEVLRDITRKDLESFFQYINVYQSYIGKQYRASELFSGWMVTNSPYSYPEIKNALFPVYKNKAEFNKRLPVYKTDIRGEAAARSLAVEAMHLSDANQYQEAHELANFALALAYGVNDTVNKPTVHICKAQIYLNQDKYAEALSECDKVISTALVAKDRDIEVQGTIKKAFCQVKLLKHREADALLTIAEKKLSGYKASLTESQYAESMRKIYEHRSFIRYAAGEYEKALALLDTAIYFNDQINSYSARMGNAVFYSFIGRVLNKQGKPTEALAAFTKASGIYRDNIDGKNWAIVENDIAYSYYLLGDYRRSIESCEKAMKRLLKDGDDNDAGYSKSLIGSSYWQLGKYDSAVANHTASIELRKKGKNLPGQAFSWQKIGELYQLSGSKTAALQALDSAAFIYKNIKDSSGLAETFNKKGEVFLNDENYKKATEWFEKAKGISSKSSVEALFQLGDAWSSIDTAKSRKYYEAAREESKSDGNTSYQFFSARSLASLAYRSGNIVTGDRYYEECVLLSKQMNTAYSWGKCLSLRAWRFESNSELDSALHYYQSALAVFDTVNKSEVITQLANIANVYISMGEFQKADEHFTRAIGIARAGSDSLALGNTLEAASFLYSRTAEFAKGIASSDSALSIFRKSGNMIRLANTYGSKAAVLSSMGEYRQSVTAYLYADSLYKEELVEELRGPVFNNIGVVYIGQEDYSNALKYLEKSMAIRKKGIVDEGYLLTKGNIAECLLGLKKTNEARSLLLEIFPIAKKMKLHRAASGMALVLGKLFLQENKLAQATEYYSFAKEYALVSGERDKMIDALINLGRIAVREKKEDAAKASLQESVRLAKQYKIAGAWESYYELGLLFYNQQQADSAIVYFKQAVELLDKNAENLYGGEEAKKIFDNDPRKSDLYNKITFAYYNTGNIKEAWAYANRSSIAGIKELSGSLTVNSSDAEKNEALKKLLAMQQSKKALENTLEKQEGVARQETLKKIEILEADYNNFLQDVVAQYPELSTYFSRSNADEFNNYKGKLPDDVAVALYLVNDKTLMIFTLTNEKLAVDTMTLDIAPRIALFIETIKDVKKQTGTGPLSERSEPQDEEKAGTGVEFKDISDELYNALITTVYDKIGQKKKLCIIPTGIFSNMPFQCLGKKTGANDFRFLVEDHSIFYTNKMSVFNAIKKKDTGNLLRSSFAAFGVPDASLRYNITEVKAIGSILGADSTVYTDARATESMAKKSLRSKKYIHFATHGVLNYSSDYSQSYLKLLPDKDTAGGNNGQLTMREVQKLGITDCEMVILSACQTAVTKQLVKGWNISPANSFLVSNVRSVVASLWKVADEPTGLLMEYFYQNLDKQMDKVEALRQAQIKLSQDARFRHPNYWGAFVLYGEWQ